MFCLSPFLASNKKTPCFLGTGPLAMNCLGLAIEWEKCAKLREQFRDLKVPMVKGTEETYCVPNRPNSISNIDFLGPILARLSETESLRLPHLEDLKIEVSTLFQKCGTSWGEKEAYKTSVELKKLCGFIKRRCARKEVTKEKGFRKHGWGYIKLTYSV